MCLAQFTHYGVGANIDTMFNNVQSLVCVALAFSFMVIMGLLGIQLLDRRV
ncbi:MAG: hypothetical protein Rpha_1624 [Candidatus Ruthia sp. Apha_13_S6]|nr:hypothetical protein [Candidatus Ruthia sp. Apha_13_S6]